MVLFWKGKQLRIKRKGHEEDNKCNVSFIEYLNLLDVGITTIEEVK